MQSVLFDDLLSIAVNNQLKLIRVTKQPVSRENPFLFETLDQKATGTFIHSLTPLGGRSIIVADMAGSGVCTYDVIKQKNGSAKLAEAASSYLSLWTNQVVAISDTQFIVFD